MGMTLAVFISTFANACICDTPLDPVQYHKALTSATSKEGVCGNLVMNSINQILAFVGAGFVYSFLRPGIGVGLNTKSSSGHFWKFVVGAVVMTLAFSPFLDLTYRLNEWVLQGTSFHAFASGLEAQALVLTKAMLNIESTGQLIATLLRLQFYLQLL